MPMMDSAMAGPALGSEDGAMMPPGGMQPPGGPEEMVPCPACQGIGTVPPEQADEITALMGPPPEEMGGMPGEPPGGGLPPDLAGALGGAPPPGGPESPVTGNSIQDYDDSRPQHLKHESLDHGEIDRQGKRAKERMRQGGRFGSP